MINGNFCFALLELQGQINVCFVNVGVVIFVASAIKYLDNGAVKAFCKNFIERLTLNRESVKKVLWPLPSRHDNVLSEYKLSLLVLLPNNHVVSPLQYLNCSTYTTRGKSTRLKSIYQGGKLKSAIFSLFRW